jgi:hypothetical protein
MRCSRTPHMNFIAIQGVAKLLLSAHLPGIARPVMGGLGKGLIQLNGQVHRAFLPCSELFFRRGLAH